MITIRVNRKLLTLACPPYTLTSMLDQHASRGGHYAVVVNQQVIPASQQGNYHLQEGDEIELIVPMQGG
jgi:sulfur carrier protein